MANFADEDDDDTEAALTPEAPSSPTPAMDPKAMLYAALQRKLGAQGDVNAARADMTSGMNRNALYAALAASAAQIGTIGGKSASAAPVAQMAQGANQAQGLNVQGAEEQAKSADQDRDQLYKYLAQQSNIDFKKQKLSQDKDYQSNALAEKERHNQAVEDLGGQKIDINVAGQGTKADANTAKTDAKNYKDVNARFDKLNDKIRGSVRDSLGDEKKKLRAATHAMAMIGPADPNHLNSIQMQELGGALATQVAPGSPSENIIKNMTPETAPGDLAKVYQYISGKPEPSNQGEFVNFFKDMLTRQANTSMDIIRGEIGPTIANFSDLKDQDEDKFNNILSQAGIQVDDRGQMVAYQPEYVKSRMGSLSPQSPSAGSGAAMAAPAPQGASTDPKIVDYAKTHQLTYDQADKILKGRGYKP